VSGASQWDGLVPSVPLETTQTHVGVHLTVCSAAGRRRCAGYRPPGCAAACWGVGDGGRPAGGLRGHAGRPPLLRGRGHGSGRLCEVAAGCGVGGVGCSETPEISSLEKQTSVNYCVQTDRSSPWIPKNNHNLLRAAEVDPILPVTIKAAGASKKRK